MSEPPAGLGEVPDASDLAVAAINLENATTSWTVLRSDELLGVSEVSAGDGLVFVRSGYCGNAVGAALNPTSGATVWRTEPDLLVDEMNRVNSAPGLAAGGIIVMPASLGLVGLDTATGRAKWTSEVGLLAAESESMVILWSPVAGLLRVLDRLTGAEQWSLRLSEPLQLPVPGQAPVPATATDLPPIISAVADEEHVYVRVDSEVTAYDARTGDAGWSAYVGASQGFVLLRGLDVLLTESDGGVLALAVADGSERWSVPNNTDAEQLGMDAARVADGNLYLPIGSSLNAFDLETGTSIWETPSESFGFRVVAAGNGRVVANGGGRLHLMDASTGAELWDSTALADPQGILESAIYALGDDSLYLAWFCGGG